jgi:hypothetical protein
MARQYLWPGILVAHASPSNFLLLIGTSDVLRPKVQDLRFLHMHSLIEKSPFISAQAIQIPIREISEKELAETTSVF